LKEKLLAAHRGGIGTVIIPKENRRDLREVPRRVLKTTRVVLVDHVDEVLREALVVADPDVMFGPPRPLMESRGGELVVNGVPPTPPDEGDEPPPAVPPPDSPGEQPGA